jgi:hypothetical protein
MLKNSVFRRILEIREQKKRPKLGDILEYFKASNMSRDQIINKLTVLFSDQKPSIYEEDPKFDELSSLFEGIKKNLQINLEALNEIDQKINTLQNRRELRERKPDSFFDEMKKYQIKEEI